MRVDREKWRQYECTREGDCASVNRGNGDNVSVGKMGTVHGEVEEIGAV